MKLGKRNLILVSFTLFSLFFGAGNLIFPPFLGQSAGNHTFLAWLGFLITAVIIPMLAVVLVAKFDGLENIAGKVNPIFAKVFTILIYLSIGPCLGIPRAASVPFEMAIAPYLPQSFSMKWMMILYSAIFFSIVLWLSLSPNKLINRIGKFITPSLLILISLVFVSFLFMGTSVVAEPTGDYINNPFSKGFLDGYHTLDAIAGLNFGLIVVTILNSLHIKEKKDIIHYSALGGLIAGIILACIYGMLSYLGMKSSGVYPLQGNGAWTLRCITNQLFGAPGAVLLAIIFSLACLSASVGLVTSTAQYFSSLTKKKTTKLSYKKWVIIIIIFAFFICNLGLNAILNISVPILNIIYPVAIVLIILGYFNNFIKTNPFTYPIVIICTSTISILYSFDDMFNCLGAVSDILSHIPLYKIGMGWIVVSVIAFILSLIINAIRKLVKK